MATWCSGNNAPSRNVKASFAGETAENKLNEMGLWRLPRFQTSLLIFHMENGLDQMDIGTCLNSDGKTL